MSALPMESSLIVPIPAAGTVVEPWRERLDPFSDYGMVAHVTVIYPFLEPDDWPPGLAQELADTFSSMPAFAFDLNAVRWFEPDVAWAAPDPAEPFRSMTRAMRRRWPALRPYGGTEPVEPHLTIGVTDDRSALEEAASAVAGSLPIACSAEEVRLMTGSRTRGSWQMHHSFRLGPRA